MYVRCENTHFVPEDPKAQNSNKRLSEVERLASSKDYVYKNPLLLRSTTSSWACIELLGLGPFGPDVM